MAFLPGSQVDIRPVRDVQPLMDIPPAVPDFEDGPQARQHRRVAPRDPRRDPCGSAHRPHLDAVSEGQIIDGVVKNITDYGAFVDLGGIDGLLHVTDMSYKRVNHPNEVINIGDTVKVQIIRINKDTQRISLGMKQLESDPWEGAEAKYAIGAKLSGRVTNITEYGAFVELEPGIEGLVHVSEMSVDEEERPPRQDRLDFSQEVEVIVLEVDSEKRRVSLGLKQAVSAIPGMQFEAEAHPCRLDR